MKFQKNGFTLSELLIALILIGVVAALTIPRFNRYYTKEQTATTLAKTVNQIEAGFADVFQIANTSSPTSVYEDIRIIQKRDLHIAENGYARIADMANHSLINMIPTENNGEFRISKCTSIIRFVAPVFPQLPNGEIPSDYVDNTMISVDTNGEKRPNRDGEDRFAFFIHKSGKLIPYGNNPAACTSDNINLSCTARIVSEGYKINY